MDAVKIMESPIFFVFKNKAFLIFNPYDFLNSKFITFEINWSADFMSVLLKFVYL